MHCVVTPRSLLFAFCCHQWNLKQINKPEIQKYTDDVNGSTEQCVLEYLQRGAGQGSPNLYVPYLCAQCIGGLPNSQHRHWCTWAPIQTDRGNRKRHVVAHSVCIHYCLPASCNLDESHAGMFSVPMMGTHLKWDAGLHEALCWKVLVPCPASHIHHFYCLKKGRLCLQFRFFPIK